MTDGPRFPLERYSELALYIYDKKHVEGKAKNIRSSLLFLLFFKNNFFAISLLCLLCNRVRWLGGGTAVRCVTDKPCIGRVLWRALPRGVQWQRGARARPSGGAGWGGAASGAETIGRNKRAAAAAAAAAAAERLHLGCASASLSLSPPRTCHYRGLAPHQRARTCYSVVASATRVRQHSTCPLAARIRMRFRNYSNNSQSSVSLSHKHSLLSSSLSVRHAEKR